MACPNDQYSGSADCCCPAADRLTMLGPRPVIASLSLGATRTFRMKNMAFPKQTAAEAQGTGPDQQQQLLSQSLAAQSDLHARPRMHGNLADSKAVSTSKAETAFKAAACDGKDAQHQQLAPVQLTLPGRHTSQSEPAANQTDEKQQCLRQGSDSRPIQQPVSRSQYVVSADVQLPHNTLVIMWPPMQEAWKHEVSSCFNELPHTSCLCCFM